MVCVGQSAYTDRSANKVHSVASCFGWCPGLPAHRFLSSAASSPPKGATELLQPGGWCELPAAAAASSSSDSRRCVRDAASWRAFKRAASSGVASWSSLNKAKRGEGVLRHSKKKNVDLAALFATRLKRDRGVAKCAHEGAQTQQLGFSHRVRPALQHVLSCCAIRACKVGCPPHLTGMGALAVLPLACTRL
jgi:hypothetical protein